MTNATELLSEIRRLKASLNSPRVKRRNESRCDYIKRRAKNKCSYCQKRFDKKSLKVALEPYHIVKSEENIDSILTYYRIDKITLLSFNPDLEEADILPGVMLRIPDDFKIFPNTHGICYCDKCGEKRGNLGLDHVSFIHHLLEQRKIVRNQVTHQLRRKVYKRDKYKCIYCEIEYGLTKPNTYLTLDHKNPVVGGGTSDERNLVTACLKHNLNKKNTPYEDYIKIIKRRKIHRENGEI